jgi:hypothetical protein
MVRMKYRVAALLCAVALVPAAVFAQANASGAARRGSADRSRVLFRVFLSDGRV